jgi:hypothetical protein
VTAPEVHDEAPGATRAAWVRDLLTRHESIELEFVQHRDSYTVHVIVPDDPDVEPEVVTPQDDAAKADVIMGLLRSNLPTVCGYVSTVWMSPTIHSDNKVWEFEDHLLCARCQKALGEHANRAFEHPVPRTSAEDES